MIFLWHQVKDPRPRKQYIYDLDFHFLMVWGLCHRAGSDLFLFVCLSKIINDFINWFEDIFERITYRSIYDSVIKDTCIYNSIQEVFKELKYRLIIFAIPSFCCTLQWTVFLPYIYICSSICQMSDKIQFCSNDLKIYFCCSLYAIGVVDRIIFRMYKITFWVVLHICAISLFK